MSNTNAERVDEISQYYALVIKLGKISESIFWISVVLSFVIPYSTSIVGKTITNIIQICFLLLVLVYFGISQSSTLYYFPQAEFKRRKQLLSNSFGVALSYDSTEKYYNNKFAPSIKRLGANTMENAFFSEEIASKMLERRRIIIVGYLVVWFLVLVIRHDNLEIIAWITQLVFSGEIVAEWLKLEIFRFRCQQMYQELYSYFLLKLEEDSSNEIATLLNAYTTYETAKSDAGILLSTRDFSELNPTLSIRLGKNLSAIRYIDIKGK
jgi:hypothetical protein